MAYTPIMPHRAECRFTEDGKFLNPKGKEIRDDGLWDWNHLGPLFGMEDDEDFGCTVQYEFPKAAAWKVFDALDAAIAEMHFSLGLKHLHDLERTIKDISLQTFTIGMKKVTASLDDVDKYLRECYSLTTALESFKDTAAVEPSADVPMDGTPTTKELDEHLVTDVQHVQAMVARLEEQAQTSERWLLAFLGEGRHALHFAVPLEEVGNEDEKEDVKDEEVKEE